MTTRKSNSVIEQLKRLHSKPAPSPDSMGDGLRSRYVAMVIADHQSGKTDALMNYKEVYGESHVQAEDESDLVWIRRCAEQDYWDGEHGAAVYQDFYDALEAEQAPEKKFVRCDESILGVLASLGAEFDFNAYDHDKGGIEAVVNLTARARLAEYSADFQVEDLLPVGKEMDAPYGKVRVATMYGGLVPVREFDSVEIENMTDDPNAPGELIVADDYWHDLAHQPDTVTAISVRLHYRRGGVETVSDFCFDPTTPGKKEEAEAKARDLAVSLGDMIMMADPELKVGYVLGRGAVEPQRDRSNELTC